MLNRPGVLGSLIILVTLVVLVIVTVVRYSDRFPAAGQAGDHPEEDSQRFEVAWNELPQVQAFELIERSGQPLSRAALEGKPWVGSFFFSRCPSICKRQNETLQRLQARLRKAEMDVTLVSITVDPAYDTPEVLTEYAKLYNADAEQWLFLTGAYEKIVALGNESFGLPIGPETHSTSLLLVDRWGRLRDRYDWEQPEEIKRLEADLAGCLEEKSPPQDLVLETRVPPAKDLGLISDDADEAWRNKPWIDEFTLTNAEGKPFGTDDLAGRVWVANTFFTRCPTICKRMMAEVKTLHDALEDKPVTFVSLTSDPDYDTPPRLRTYAEPLQPDPERWQFLTGNLLYSRRIMSEYLKMYVDLTGPMHDEHLVLVDKWGEVRGKYAFDDPDALVQLRMEVDRLIAETEPPVQTPAGEVEPDDAAGEVEPDDAAGEVEPDDAAGEVEPDDAAGEESGEPGNEKINSDKAPDEGE